MRIRGTTRELDGRARELRATMTVAERRLWSALRAERLDGLDFKRQHPVGRFILDFCCPSRRLAVEVDADIHNEAGQAAHDQARTSQLEAYGYRVVRVRNEEVLTAMDDVLGRIRDAAAEG